MLGKRIHLCPPILIFCKCRERNECDSKLMKEKKLFTEKKKRTNPNGQLTSIGRCVFAYAIHWTSRKRTDCIIWYLRNWRIYLFALWLFFAFEFKIEITAHFHGQNVIHAILLFILNYPSFFFTLASWYAFDCFALILCDFFFQWFRSGRWY